MSFSQRDLERVDWAILQNGWVALYWKHEILEADAAWLRGNGYAIHRLDCGSWATSADALRELSATLGFPDYYGQNLDALNDCLRDIEVPPEGGTAIVLGGYDRFAARDPETAHAILDIIADNARTFMLFGLRLLTLVQSDDPRLSLDPVGATPVMWNRREWLHASRGL